MSRRLGLCITLAVFAASVAASAKITNIAITPGARLLPFTSNVVSGEFRGQQHCFVCGLILDHPAVLVFARKMDEPTTRLIRSLDSYMHDHLADHLLCWTVFLGPTGTDSEVALEDRADTLVNQDHVDCLPVTVLGDPQGPPGYRIDPKSVLVALTTHARRILDTHQFNAHQWNDAAAKTLVGDIQQTLKLH